MTSDLRPSRELPDEAANGNHFIARRQTNLRKLILKAFGEGDLVPMVRKLLLQARGELPYVTVSASGEETTHIGRCDVAAAKVVLDLMIGKSKPQSDDRGGAPAFTFVFNQPADLSRIEIVDAPNTAIKHVVNEAANSIVDDAPIDASPALDDDNEPF